MKIEKIAFESSFGETDGLQYEVANFWLEPDRVLLPRILCCQLLYCASITFLTLWSEVLFFSFSFKKSGFPHKVHVYFVKTRIVEGYVRKYAKQGDVENQGLQSCL